MSSREMAGVPCVFISAGESHIQPSEKAHFQIFKRHFVSDDDAVESFANIPVEHAIHAIAWNMAGLTQRHQLFAISGVVLGLGLPSVRGSLCLEFLNERERFIFRVARRAANFDYAQQASANQFIPF